MRAGIAILVLALAGCAAAPPLQTGYQPPEGSNAVFNTEPGAAPGHRLVVDDLVLGPDAVGPGHFHPWEEYLYVIEGLAIVEMRGLAPREVRAGEHYVIPARQVHTPRAGADGVRAIVVRVHDLADPVRVLVSE